MLSVLSLWSIYTASYLMVYIFLLFVSILKKIECFQQQEGISSFFQFCLAEDYVLWGVLVLLIVFSVITTICLNNIKPNTRIKYSPQDDITFEIAGYILSQVLTILTIVFTEYWVPICIAIFVFTGIIFIKSKRIHLSPIFVIPLGYTIHQTSEGKILIIRGSRDRFRRVLVDESDGVEARELETGVYFVKR